MASWRDSLIGRRDDLMGWQKWDLERRNEWAIVTGTPAPWPIDTTFEGDLLELNSVPRQRPIKRCKYTVYRLYRYRIRRKIGLRVGFRMSRSPYCKFYRI